MPTQLPGLAYGRPAGKYFHGLLAQPNCAECPLMMDTKVYPDGPNPARLAFVGEEPGDTELAEGRGFIGPSGQLLWHLAGHVGIDRSEVWVTNAALCKARKIFLSNGAVIPLPVVKAMAARACRSRLVNELIGIDPVVIVPLGNWALWALSDIPKSRIYGYRGSRIEVDLRVLADRIARGLTQAPIRQVQNG